MLSKCLTAFASFLALVASAPTPASSSSTSLATVDLRIIGPQNSYYSTSKQSSTSDQSRHLTIIVGQTLSLDRRPLHIQGLEITSVKAGESLSLLPAKVVDNDWRVVCTARIDGREDLFEFDMKDRGVLLAGGRMAKVTRLNCVIDEEAL